MRVHAARRTVTPGIVAGTGAAALSIIPDRNYTPGVKDRKLENLHHVVEMARNRQFPIIVGTERNAPGNKFVDSFQTAELAPLLPVFLRGAHIVYAHSVLQGQAGLGYLSRWATKTFNTLAAKNDFFESLGQKLTPETEGRLAGLTETATPEQVLGCAFA